MARKTRLALKGPAERAFFILPRNTEESQLKLQVPNTKHQTPNTKHQTPKKSQIPSSKPRPALRAWNLGLGAWSFSGVWCLVFGVSIPVGLFAIACEINHKLLSSELIHCVY